MAGTMGSAARLRERERRAGRRVVRVGLCLALLVGVIVATPARGADRGGPTSVPTLSDEDLFVWSAQFVSSAAVGDPSSCNATAQTCFDHFFDVAPGATGFLRVGIDVKLEEGYVRDWADPAVTGATHSPGSSFRIDVYGPDGAFVKATAKKRPYSQELWVAQPAPGRWRARVTPVDVERRFFRLRAGIDVLEPHGAHESPLDPNLRAVPPFELTFHVPTTNYGPGLDHDHATGACMVEETAEGATDLGETEVRTDCLRFSFGMENAGRGPLAIGFCGVECGDAVAPTLPAWPAVQLRYCTDREASAPPYRKVCSQDHRAGTLRFDPTHAHSHYEEAWAAELFQVVHRPGQPTPDLVSLGSAPKLGFDPSAELMPQFDRMFQDDTAWPRQGWVALQAGWADIYEWNRSGNGIPVSGGMGPGRYLVRAVVDPDGHIIETNERDNASYALFDIVAEGDGLRIVVHERGIGASPWDPPRRVVTAIP